MPRTARIVIPEYPYHVTQRGNYRQEIFQDDRDREKYLSWIEEYSRKHKLPIYAYCLMNNHVHFICKPLRKDSLAKVFSVAHMRYSQYFNKKMKAKGHLWQGRFYSCVMENQHLYAALRYVERNPVRANLVTKPWEWEWSSAGYHAGEKEMNQFKLADITEILDLNGMQWKEYIDTKEDMNDIKGIRKCTILGRPWGDKGFIKKLAEKLGQELIFRPKGRPKKNKK